MPIKQEVRLVKIVGDEIKGNISKGARHRWKKWYTKLKTWGVKINGKWVHHTNGNRKGFI